MRHILFGLLAATALAAPAFSQDAARMDKAASAEADRNGFMGAILVAQDGKILFDKGYGSATHLAALREHGPTPLHRRSFAPVAQCYLDL